MGCIDGITSYTCSSRGILNEYDRIDGYFRALVQAKLCNKYWMKSITFKRKNVGILMVTMW